MNFNVAADAYDRYMGHWSRLLSGPFADFAGFRVGDSVLDVGCGPGNLTAELVSRLGLASVTAIDPSPSFVAAARERIPDLRVRQANAEELPFPDATFDVALAQLVVHLMADPVAGLAEMARVVGPGRGVVAACVWNYEGGHGPLGPFWTAARDLEPGVRDESELPGTSRGQLAGLFSQAGILDQQDTILTATRDYGSFDEWWEPFTLGVGPGGAYVAGLASESAAKLRDRCRSLLPTAPFSITAEAWAVRGRPAARP